MGYGTIMEVSSFRKRDDTLRNEVMKYMALEDVNNLKLATANLNKFYESVCRLENDSDSVYVIPSDELHEILTNTITSGKILIDEAESKIAVWCEAQSVKSDIIAYGDDVFNNESETDKEEEVDINYTKDISSEVECTKIEMGSIDSDNVEESNNEENSQVEADDAVQDVNIDELAMAPTARLLDVDNMFNGKDSKKVKEIPKTNNFFVTKFLRKKCVISGMSLQDSIKVMQERTRYNKDCSFYDGTAQYDFFTYFFEFFVDDRLGVVGAIAPDGIAYTLCFDMLIETKVQFTNKGINMMLPKAIASRYYPDGTYSPKGSNNRISVKEKIDNWLDKGYLTGFMSPYMNNVNNKAFTWMVGNNWTLTEKCPITCLNRNEILVKAGNFTEIIHDKRYIIDTRCGRPYFFYGGRLLSSYNRNECNSNEFMTADLSYEIVFDLIKSDIDFTNSDLTPFTNVSYVAPKDNSNAQISQSVKGEDKIIINVPGVNYILDIVRSIIFKLNVGTDDNPRYDFTEQNVKKKLNLKERFVLKLLRASIQ